MKNKRDNLYLNNNDPYFNVKTVLERDLNKSDIFIHTGTYVFEQGEINYHLTIEIRYRHLSKQNDIFDVTITKSFYDSTMFTEQIGHCFVSDGTIRCTDSFAEAAYKASNHKDWRERFI